MGSCLNDFLNTLSAILRDLYRQEEWANTTLMFKRDKGQVLLEAGSTLCSCTSWCLPGCRQHWRKGPEGLGIYTLSMSQQCALAAETANSALGVIHRGIARTSREGIIPLYLAHLAYHNQFRASKYRKHINRFLI